MPLAQQSTSVPVVVDEGKCIADKGCTVCVDVCPLDVLRISEETGKAYMKYDECWYCMPCEADCPTNAVSVPVEDEQLNAVRRNAVLGETAHRLRQGVARVKDTVYPRHVAGLAGSRRAFRCLVPVTCHDEPPVAGSVGVGAQLGARLRSVDSCAPYSTRQPPRGWHACCPERRWRR